MAKLTLETKRLVVQQIQAGMSFSGACRSAGVLPQQGFQWMNRALVAWDAEEPTDEELLYVDFSTEVNQALAAFEEEQVASLLRDAEGDWRARAWILERRFGRDWAQQRDKVEVEVTGEVGVHHDGAVQVEASRWATRDRVKEIAGIFNELGLTQAAIEGTSRRADDLDGGGPDTVEAELVEDSAALDRGEGGE